jgi:hypothetical protein
MPPFDATPDLAAGAGLALFGVLALYRAVAGAAARLALAAVYFVAGALIGMAIHALGFAPAIVPRSAAGLPPALGPPAALGALLGAGFGVLAGGLVHRDGHPLLPAAPALCGLLGGAGVGVAVALLHLLAGR